MRKQVVHKSNHCSFKELKVSATAGRLLYRIP
jgi:hypothetical protein